MVSTTWSPTRRRETSAPMASTTPAPSWPSTRGKGSGIQPSTTCTSDWQMPAARMRTRTSPRRGASSSNSSIVIPAPGLSATAARTRISPPVM